jgi:hypothetical protein
MNDIVNILKYYFPHTTEIKLEKIANKIETIIKDPLKEDETFYIHNSESKELFSINAPNRVEALEELNYRGIGDSVCALNKEDLILYLKDGWTILEE